MKREQIVTYNAWRGICAIGILFSHMYYVADSANPFWHEFHRLFMSKGAICSSFFFLCSGFFLNYTWKQGAEFGAYLKGKLKRIYPITLIVFLMALAVSLLLSGQSDEAGDAAPGSLEWCFSAAANVFLFKAFIPVESVFYSFHGPSWYISALFGFYLLAYPFMRGLYGEKRDKWRKIIVLTCAGAYAAELVVCIIVHACSLSSLWLCYVNPWFRIFGECFAGILLCEYMPQIQEKLRKCPVTVLEVAGVVLFLAAFLLRNVIQLKIYTAWIQILFMGAVLIAFRQGTGKVSSVLKTRPFQFLGGISFELYMTHAFVYEGLPIAAGIVSKASRQFLTDHPGTRFLITFVLCILFAWVFHLFMNLLNQKVIKKL
ncbi:MAG: acyltransferase [Oscillospiraceae bacterium]|nr:acyltransferase [Oscillospiraceae bacterium]